MNEKRQQYVLELFCVLHKVKYELKTYQIS